MVTKLLVAVTGIVAGLSVFTITASHVDAIPLMALLGENGAIQQGNILFSGFIFFRNDLGGNPPPTDANNIDVQGITAEEEQGVRYGLKVTGPFVANSQGNQFTGATIGIGFDVHITDPAFLIDEAHTTLDGSFTGEGAAVLLVGSDHFQIGEIFDANNPVILAGSSPHLTSHVSSDRVVTALAFASGEFQGQPTFGTASIRSFEITFSQVASGESLPGFTSGPTSSSAIPEPTSVFLFASGIIALGFRHWKREPPLGND
jgi:hypothetical protein